jgi:hypothetical protein
MKKIMKKIIQLMLLISLVSIQTGCVSYMVYNDSKKEVALSKAIASNNTRAISALREGASPSKIESLGVSVSFLEAVSHRIPLQLGAGVADIGILAATYAGLQEINDSGSSNENAKPIENQSGGDVVIITGSQNVSVSQQETTGVIPSF